MNHRIDGWAKLLAPIAITAVISLAPGPGFVTLTIPDDTPDSQSVAIPDFPHLNKRASGESPLQIDAIFSLSGMILPRPSISGAEFAQKEYSLQNQTYYQSIRAPPSIS